MFKLCLDCRVSVDGYWSTWSTWSGCDVTCDSGHIIRTRTCTPPEYGGNECTGNNTESQTCTLSKCPGRCMGNTKMIINIVDYTMRNSVIVKVNDRHIHFVISVLSPIIQSANASNANTNATATFKQFCHSNRARTRPSKTVDGFQGCSSLL